MSLYLYEHEDGRTMVCRFDDKRLVGNPAWHRIGPCDGPVADRRTAQTLEQRAASPCRRVSDPLAGLTDAQRHSHALQAIKLRGGRLAPLPECFRAPAGGERYWPGADDAE